MLNACKYPKITGKSAKMDNKTKPIKFKTCLLKKKKKKETWVDRPKEKNTNEVRNKATIREATSRVVEEGDAIRVEIGLVKCGGIDVVVVSCV